MRPATVRQSALRAPLNAFLGTEANVRLLRILTQTAEPVTATQLAREAGLSAPGAYQALEALRSAGIVERVGRGSRGQLRLRNEHPLAPALASLFEAERLRVDQLLADLRAAVKRLSPPPRSVWLFGPVADGADAFGDPVDLAVITGTKDIATVTEKLVSEAAELGARHDVRVEVRGLTEPDLENLPASERATLGRSLVVAGLAPEVYFTRVGDHKPRAGAGKRSHADHDRHLLRFAALVADRMKIDPTIIDRALQHVRRRLPAASAGERKELLEWERVLRTMSPRRLRDFLVDRGPRATRLRQTLPFVDVVARQERERILSDPGE